MIDDSPFCLCSTYRYKNKIDSIEKAKAAVSGKITREKNIKNGNTEYVSEPNIPEILQLSLSNK